MGTQRQIKNKKTYNLLSLFSSETGDYQKACKHFDNINCIAIGKNYYGKDTDNYINMDLSAVDEQFGAPSLAKQIQKRTGIKYFDLILGSAPCEIFSALLSTKTYGQHIRANKYFKVINTNINNEKIFQLQNKETLNIKSYMKITNGINCHCNFWSIVRELKPKVFMLENPAHGLTWDFTASYIKDIPPYYLNLVNYSIWDLNFSKKPTVFCSNVKLNFEEKKTIIKNGNSIRSSNDINTICSADYGTRSKIPIPLLVETIKQFIDYIER